MGTGAFDVAAKAGAWPVGYRDGRSAQVGCPKVLFVKSVLVAVSPDLCREPNTNNRIERLTDAVQSLSLHAAFPQPPHSSPGRRFGAGCRVRINPWCRLCLRRDLPEWYPLIAQAQTTQWAVNGGVNFWTAPGKPTELLREFVTWFDANVEPITLGNGDDWSWAEPALVPPTNATYSNHSSGTAVDLNLEIHGGQGFSGTFTPEQTAKIRAKLASMGGQIVWGGEWSTLRTIRTSRSGSGSSAGLSVAGAGFSSERGHWRLRGANRVRPLTNTAS